MEQRDRCHVKKQNHLKILLDLIDKAESLCREFPHIRFDTRYVADVYSYVDILSGKSLGPIRCGLWTCLLLTGELRTFREMTDRADTMADALALLTGEKFPKQVGMLGAMGQISTWENMRYVARRLYGNAVFLQQDAKEVYDEQAFLQAPDFLHKYFELARCRINEFYQ